MEQSFRFSDCVSDAVKAVDEYRLNIGIKLGVVLDSQCIQRR